MESNKPVPFKEVLWKYRMAAGLTQAELAEAADISTVEVSHLERGARLRPHTDTVHRLIDALHLSGQDAALFKAAARGRALLEGSDSPHTVDASESDRQVDDVPVGLTLEAERARAQFYRIFHKLERRIKETAMSIVLWSPFPDSDGPVSAKRHQIQRYLERAGHFVARHASQSRQSGRVYDAELTLSADAANLTVILVEDESDLIEQAVAVCGHPKILPILPKVFALFPVGCKDRISDSVWVLRGYGGIFWYEDQDIEKCNALTETAERCEARRAVHAFNRGRSR